MSKVMIDRVKLERVLEALEHGVTQLNGIGIPLEADPLIEAITALRAALAQGERPCSCRWVNDTLTQECTLHRITKESAHYWAERAKMAEAKVAALAQEEQPADAEAALRLALAQRDWAFKQLMAQEHQEPAVRVVKTGATLRMDLREGVLALPDGEHELYTAPPRREQEQGPVAWRYKGMMGMPWSLSDDGYYVSCKRDKGYTVEPLYTHPPRREWQGLTDDELGELMHDSCGYPMCPNGDDLAFARAIEVALKERNHG
jgi:hypothetical protein